MSQWRGRLEENPELERAVDLVQQYYHLALGALLLGFMLWNRVRPWQNFVVDGEVLFSGNDAWYHYRSTAYVVRHWPQTQPFDPWTYFPVGTASGQFGTLFDQLMATAALVVGLGSPSDHTVRLVVLFAPAVLGVLTGVPTYLIGRRLAGRAGGVVALTILALASGSILQRSVVGFSDHQIAEALFQAFGVLGMMVAVTVARRDRPVYEQFVDRDIDGLRDTVVWSVLAGFAVALYLWVWPFGVLLIGILGTYLLVQLLIEFQRDDGPEHTAIVGTIALGTTGVLLLPAISTASFTVGDFSLLHPTMAFLVAGGCAFMTWLARVWEDRGIDDVFYPVTVLSLIVVGVVVVRVASPGVFNLFANNLVRIFGGVVGIAPSAAAGTVGEIQRLNSPVLYFFQTHGFAAFIAGIGALLILFRNLLSDRLTPEQLLVVVWTVFVMAAAVTQVRFAYYATIPIAGLTAYTVGRVFDAIDTGDDEVPLQAYQVLTIVAVVVLIVAPMAAVAPATNTVGGPGGGIKGWSDGLEWMQEHTPEEGTFGGASNEMDYYGSYQVVDDYEYQDGQYGVLSWWDYGHWITTQGERIPNANPFQQGATSAANFLLAPNESQADTVRERLSDGEAETRYVAVDWKMAETNSRIGGKFFAPPAFYNVSDVSRGDYYSRVYSSRARSLRGLTFVRQKQAYYESTVIRLYHFHGSAVEPEPVVVDWETSTLQGRQVPQASGRRAVFQNRSVEAARAYTRNDTTSSIGGIGVLPSERVPAMEHYRLVGTSERKATASANYNRGLLSESAAIGLGYQRVNSTEACGSDVTLTVNESSPRPYACLPQSYSEGIFHQTSPQWLKIFERVPGATIEGTGGPSNGTVRASVEMYNPASNETFVYTQVAETDADGSFTMTVPYSTTGYDEFGPDNGYTNVSVRANSSYQFQAGSLSEGKIYSGSAEVSEGQVLGVDEQPVAVQLNSTEIQLQEPTNETTTNETTTNETGS